MPQAVFRAAVLAVRTTRLFPALGGARSHLLSFAARACSCWEPRPAAGKCAVDSCQRAHLFARVCARALLRRTASAASSRPLEISHQPALFRAAMDCNCALAKALATDRGRPLTIACHATFDRCFKPSVTQHCNAWCFGGVTLPSTVVPADGFVPPADGRSRFAARTFGV